MKLVKGIFISGIFLSTLVLVASGLSENLAQAQPKINPSLRVREYNNLLIADISELAVLKQVCLKISRL